jgi:monoamine oxidase
MDRKLFDIPESPEDYVHLISRKKGFCREPMPFQARVAVIGAGAAGLTAAYELARAGIRPVIYEVADRIGGRLYSYRFPGDSRAIAELGAMRFPPTAATLFHFLKEFGLETEAFPDPLVVPTVLYFNNEPHVCRGEEELPQPLRSAAKKWARFIDGITHLDKRKCSDSRFRRNDWQEQVDRYAGASFYQVLAENGWSPEEISLFGTLGLGTGGFDSIYRISFLEILRIAYCHWEKKQKLVKGGIEQLTSRLWHSSRECRDFGEVSVSELNDRRWRPGVAFIAREGEKICIGDRKGGRDTFDAAILTCTLPAIQCNIEIGTGILSPAVMKAIRNIHHIGSTKVFVRLRKAFWKQDPRFPRCAITDEITRATYLFDFDDTESGVACLSYTWEEASQKFLALTTEERVDVCLKTLEKIPGFERFRCHVKEVFSISWEQAPHFHGAFKLNYPGQYAEQIALFEQNRAADPAWDKGVYLAGDSVSFSGGWVEGALQTGIQAAISAIGHIQTAAKSKA